jgi:hypothetical protein
VPTHTEVVRLNLEYYRKQAKALFKASKAGDTKALQRLHLHSPKLESNPVPALHDALLTIAREQGFPSWPRFKTFIIESNLNFQELVAAFIDAAVSMGNAQKCCWPQIQRSQTRASTWLWSWGTGSK